MYIRRAVPGRKSDRAFVFVLAALAAGAAGAGGDAAPRVLAALAIILVAAKLVGELFERIGQPAVLGEILAGVILGNLVHLGVQDLSFVTTDPVILTLAEVGVVLLLFEVGLESDVTQMLRVGASSFLVATVGVVVPMALGWGAARLLLPDQTWHVHVFIGAILTATSVGITARVLRDLGKIQATEGRIVLGAAVIDDVMGLVVLAVVAGIVQGAATGTSVGAGDVLAIVGKSLGFLAGAILIGGRLSRIVFRLAARMHVSGLLLALALAFCFGMAWLAHQVGLAAIVGAFAAGLVLDEVSYQQLREREQHGLEEMVRPIASFLVPIFFVVTGSHVDLSVFRHGDTVLLAAVLTLVAIVGKQVCSLAVLEKGLNRLAIGVGMIPRGEVGLIFAAVGAKLGVVDPRTYGAVVIMVMVTTFVTPPALTWAFKRAA
jgi:Kef-type K+ transport system membrane component KefB